VGDCDIMRYKKFEEIYSHGDNYAVITGNNFLRYSELAHIGECIKELICGRKLVFHVCSNSIGSIAGYVAFYNNSQVQLLLSQDMEDDILNKLMELYHPKFLYIARARQSEFSELKFITNVYEYMLLETAFDTDYNIHEDLALLLSTSGSTGSQKYVRQSYNNVRSNAEAIVKYLEIDSKEKPIITLPMNYTYGLSIVNSHLLVGATLLVTEKNIMQKDFWNFFSEFNATSISGTPYTYEMLDMIGFTRMTLPSLKAMTQAGGKLRELLHKKFAEYADRNNIKFFVMYGQTEATARIAYLPYQRAVEKCGSVGIAIPGGKLMLVDKGKEIDKEHTPGEIVYYGLNVTLGYAENYSDLAKGDDRNGLLYTGDIGMRDEDGFYYILGRKKRILKMFGKRISLDELECLIKNEFNIIECCCCGKDNELSIYIENNDKKLKILIMDYIIAKIKINPVAIAIKCIDKIPKTESGKVIYTMLDK